MNDGETTDMTKKLPCGHNIGGTIKQKRRKEHKQESNKNEVGSNFSWLNSDQYIQTRMKLIFIV